MGFIAPEAQRLPWSLLGSEVFSTWKQKEPTDTRSLNPRSSFSQSVLRITLQAVSLCSRGSLKSRATSTSPSRGSLWNAGPCLTWLLAILAASSLPLPLCWGWVTRGKGSKALLAAWLRFWG